MGGQDFAEQRVVHDLAFDPDSSALLVVDMLNDFLEEGGAMVLAAGRSLYEPIGELVEAGRRRGVPIIWVCDEHPQFDREFDKRVKHCIRGSWGARIVDALEVQDGDYRIAKRRYSGFFETDLDLRLRELSVQTVIVTGLVTNICVRSTVHDAFFRGYEVVVPRECVAATGPREQESSLFDIETHYGSVCSQADVLTRLEASAPSRGGSAWPM